LARARRGWESRCAGNSKQKTSKAKENPLKFSFAPRQICSACAGKKKKNTKRGRQWAAGAWQDTPPIITHSQMFAFEHFAVCFARRLRVKKMHK